jgi:hypothetical protein
MKGRGAWDALFLPGQEDMSRLPIAGRGICSAGSGGGGAAVLGLDASVSPFSVSDGADADGDGGAGLLGRGVSTSSCCARGTGSVIERA